MKQISRRKVIVGMALAATGFGCGGANPFLVIPALFSGGRSKTPAEFPLAVHHKKRDAKVVVLVSGKLGLHPDLAGVDRMLNAELITILDARLKENEDKVLVLKMPVIDDFKSKNPNWRSLHPKDFGAAVAEGTDYVIDVEIVDMELYKPGSRGKWLQGHSTVCVTAYDLTKPLKEPDYKKEMSFDFPPFGNEIEVGSRAEVSEFRMRFVTRIASGISVKFADSSPAQRTESNFRQ